MPPKSSAHSYNHYTHGITSQYSSSYLRSRSREPACLGAATINGTIPMTPAKEFNTTRKNVPRHVPYVSRPQARRSDEKLYTNLHTCYGRQHARTTVPTTSEAPLSLDCSTYNILHPQFSNQIAYAHRFALPGFRADARLHQRRHHGQEVRVDVCQIASVPILTNSS